MPAAIIDLRAAEDKRDVVHRVVQALSEGKVVALPTETVYGIAVSALHDRAVARLAALKERPETQPFALAIPSVESVSDYVPRLPIVAERLARRCWPGPLTLVLHRDREESLLRQLPLRTQQTVCPGETIGFRVPAHDLILGVLRLMAGPLALTSANRRGAKDAVTAQDVLAAVGQDIDLIVDDGSCKFGQPSSVVQVTDSETQVLRAGVLPASALQRLSSLLILFVCTGNTCRSPMAEALMKERLSQRMGCKPADLEEQGVLVMSAGMSAMAGSRASAEAVQVMRERDLDLGLHESQPVNERLARYADVILAMTRGHREALLTHWPFATSRTHLLATDLGDVADPYGGSVETYRRCAGELEAYCDAWIDRLDKQGLLPSNPQGG